MIKNIKNDADIDKELSRIDFEKADQKRDILLDRARKEVELHPDSELWKDCEKFSSRKNRSDEEVDDLMAQIGVEMLQYCLLTRSGYLALESACYRGQHPARYIANLISKAASLVIDNEEKTTKYPVKRRSKMTRSD